MPLGTEWAISRNLDRIFGPKCNKLLIKGPLQNAIGSLEMLWLLQNILMETISNKIQLNYTEGREGGGRLN